jgi:YjbE family integral membrane protein
LFHFADSGFFALLQVILIDIVLAGDNAIVIGMAASRVPQNERRKVIFWGLVAAVVARIILATLTIRLLAIPGLMLAGGVLLLWVSWRLYRDIRKHQESNAQGGALWHSGAQTAPPMSDLDTRRLVGRAVAQITIADLSMSLDNVLAVAGAAMHHIGILAVGLLLSIGLMGIAANYVAKLLHRYPWISYAGFFIVVYVAVTMTVHGAFELMWAIV